MVKSDHLCDAISKLSDNLESGSKHSEMQRAGSRPFFLFVDSASLCPVMRGTAECVSGELAVA